MITLDEVERRLVALENSQTTNAGTMKWMVGTLGQIQATVDNHTERLDKIDGTLELHTSSLAQHTKTLAEHTKTLGEHSKTLGEHTQLLNGLKKDVGWLTKAMPEIVATAMREVLAAKGSS